MTWSFVEDHELGDLPWTAVELGLRKLYCGQDVAIGRAERSLATADAPALVHLAISDDAWEIDRLVAELARGEPSSSTQEAQHVWRYLTFAWVVAGQGEPWPDPVGVPEDRGAVLESLWVEFGSPPELNFLVPWMPSSQDPPESPRYRADGAREGLSLWLAYERQRLLDRLRPGR